MDAAVNVGMLTIGAALLVVSPVIYAVIKYKKVRKELRKDIATLFWM